MGWQDRIRQKQEIELSEQNQQRKDRLNQLNQDVGKDLPLLVDFVNGIDVANSLIGIRNEIWGIGNVSLVIVDRQQPWQRENEDTDLTNLLFKSKTYNPDFVVERATWEFADQGLRDIYPKNGLVVAANLVARWNCFVPAGRIDTSDYPGSSSWDDHLKPTCEFLRIFTYFDHKHTDNIKVSVFSSAGVYNLDNLPPREILLQEKNYTNFKDQLEKILLQDCIFRKKPTYPITRSAPYLPHKLREEGLIVHAMRTGNFVPTSNTEYYKKLAFW